MRSTSLDIYFPIEEIHLVFSEKDRSQKFELKFGKRRNGILCLSACRNDDRIIDFFQSKPDISPFDRESDMWHHLRPIHKVFADERFRITDILDDVVFFSLNQRKRQKPMSRDMVNRWKSNYHLISDAFLQNYFRNDVMKLSFSGRMRIAEVQILLHKVDILDVEIRLNACACRLYHANLSFDFLRI